MTAAIGHRTRALVRLADGGTADWILAIAMAIVLIAGRVWKGDPLAYSTWETVGGGLGRTFFAYALGRALLRRSLPLFVAHGQTRRGFMASAALVMLTYAGAGALVMAGGFLAEAAVYRALGWPHVPFFSHLFEAPHQVWFVVLEYGLLFTVWAMAGALVAVHRGHRRGLRGRLRAAGSVVLAATLVATAESAVGGPLPSLVGIVTAPPVAVAVAVCAGVAGLGFAATRAGVATRTVSSGGST